MIGRRTELLNRVIGKLVQNGDAENDEQYPEEPMHVDVIAEEQIEHSDKEKLGEEHYQPNTKEHQDSVEDARLVLQPGDDSLLEQEGEVRQHLQDERCQEDRGETVGRNDVGVVSEESEYHYIDQGADDDFGKDLLLRAELTCCHASDYSSKPVIRDSVDE